jgi:hypothetical protein
MPDEPHDHEAEAAHRGDDEVRDELPDDLTAEGYVGPYTFPDNSRRRVPGYLYLGIALVCVILWAVTLGGQPVMVNGGFLAAAVALALIGAFHLLAGWHLEVDERDALVIATRTVGFAAGHASAQLAWRGYRSRPTWRILLYSAENPALQRGFVLIDGIDGEVVSWFTEPNPEDWSKLPGGLE